MTIIYEYNYVNEQFEAETGETDQTTGPWVKYEDYEELERCIKARTITDCKMPPRIENIEAFTPKQVEDMWVHRVKWCGYATI